MLTVADPRRFRRVLRAARTGHGFRNGLVIVAASAVKSKRGRERTSAEDRLSSATGGVLQRHVARTV